MGFASLETQHQKGSQGFVRMCLLLHMFDLCEEWTKMAPVNEQEMQKELEKFKVPGDVFDLVCLHVYTIYIYFNESKGFWSRCWSWILVGGLTHFKWDDLQTWNRHVQFICLFFFLFSSVLLLPGNAGNLAESLRSAHGPNSSAAGVGNKWLTRQRVVRLETSGDRTCERRVWHHWGHCLNMAVLFKWVVLWAGRTMQSCTNWLALQLAYLAWSDCIPLRSPGKEHV